MKRFLVGLLIIVFGFTMAGCSSGQNDAAPDKNEKTIRIGVMPDVESIPFIIADKNGYFAQEGVKVKIEHFKSAQDRDSALQTGELDGVVTDVLAVVFANEGGFNLKMISSNDGNIELMAGKESGIMSMQDLPGKSIGLSTNTIMEYTTDQMLAAAGLKPEDINKIAIAPLPTRMEMLQGGKIDAGILPEPLAGLAVKNGAKVLQSTDRMANKAGAIAFTQKSLKESPQEVKAVIRAYNQAVDYLDKEPLDSFSDYVIKTQGFPPVIKDSLQLPQYRKMALPDENIVADVVEWMRTKNLIKGNYEYADLVDKNILR
ncbi:SsuA/THI5-like [Syntrophomonas zehnderi OL-4]|uniref:SsuA/THI5-like n=1 Tax=Syntrophomonas zehnderi OL-4 TaxID=690567 RepID=A0A0E3W318_9FIRM|nr:MetQ/NlpA family ABC transporter substrate-binding protein [Syntrophomonas zehnderi]CFX40881.1 SsuA/THI5-like [Syntrophomonas zehnderi OL-4]